MKNNLLFNVWAGYRPFVLLQMLLLFWVTISSAQSVPITGTVYDAQGALPGVNVQVKNKSVGTFTDAQGAFQITAAASDTLVFSSVGYLMFATRVGPQTTFKIVLQADENVLEEVLVNAGYYKVKDKERTGSIAKITAKDIETQPVSNVLAAMQGRMAGVSITQTTGVPGGGFDLQIRGINSLQQGQAPLYIVDGVPYATDPIGNRGSMVILPNATSPLSAINPASIESIEILKDADATAIYGSRGANGVVLITTKKGKSGKTQFNATVAQGIGEVAHFMKMMNTTQYLKMRAEAFANDGITEYPENAYDINGTWDQNRSTNWQKVFLGGAAKITNASASVSGGSAQTQFLLGANYNKESTVFVGDFGYRKTGVQINLQHASADKRFTAAFSGNYTAQNNLQPSEDITLAAWLLAPNAPELYTATGALNWENSTFENPLAKLTGKSKAATYDVIANTVFSYLLAPNLKISTTLGYTQLNHTESSTFPSTIYDPAYGVDSGLSTIQKTTTARHAWIAEPQLNWSHTLGDLRTTILVGATFQAQKNDQMSLLGSGFSNNNLIENPAAALDQQLLNYDASEYKYQSFFARGNFIFKDRYILNLTGRRDGSSRFGADHRFGLFGAVGAAWLFSKEKALEDQTVLSFGKLRGSYGTTGSDQIGNYKFLDTYQPGASSYEGVIGLQPARLYNSGFQWETNRKFEVALELGFLKDKLRLTTALYRTISSNQLVGIPLPGTTGFAAIQANLNATVRNEGYELTLQTVNFNSKTFKWTTDFNFSMNNNKLVSFPNLESSTYSRQYVVGKPLNIEKVYHYTGIDPETGIYTFKDVNGDGQLTEEEDKVFTSDLNPRYFGGIQNHFEYKNWQLDFLFQFVKQDNYSVPSALGIAGTLYNMPTLLLNHWDGPGSAGIHQLYTSGENELAVEALYNYLASDAAVVDASYVRLKNVSLRYEFPKKWTGPFRCRATIEAQNLITFTAYKGADPEFTGIGYVPPLRVVTAGLQVNF